MAPIDANVSHAISNTVCAQAATSKGKSPPTNKSKKPPQLPDVFNKVIPGQWLRDRLLDDYKWKFDGKTIWFDFNKNNERDADEILEDFDGDGKIGNIRDFITLYERNKEVIDENRFFKLAQSIDPGNMDVFNPALDALNILSESLPHHRIEELFSLIKTAIENLKDYPTPQTPAAMIQMLRSAILNEGIKIRPGVLDILIIGAAHQLGLEIVEVPNPNQAMSQRGIKKYDDKNPDDQETLANLYSKMYYIRARSYERMGDLITARRDYETAARLNPDLIDAHYRLGDVLCKLKQYDEAAKVYDDLLDIYTVDPKARVGRGRARLGQKMYDMAVDDFYDAISDDPDYAPAYFFLGLAYQKSGMPATALGHYKTSLEKDPQMAEAHFGIGEIWYKYARRFGRRWRYLRAYRNITRAINIAAKPKYLVARGLINWRLVKYTKTEQQRYYARAESDFTWATKLNPDYSQAWFNLCKMTYEMGKATRAVLMCKEAVKHAPKSAKFHTKLGHLYFHHREYDLAFKFFSTARSLDKKLSEAHFGLGRVWHYHKKNLMKALESYTRAIMLAGKKSTAEYYGDRGIAYFQKNMIKEAEVDLERSKKLGNYPEALLYLGLLKKKIGKIQFWEESPDIKRACTLKPIICPKKPKPAPTRPPQNDPDQ